jgi:hypothetical protein
MSMLRARHLSLGLLGLALGAAAVLAQSDGLVSHSVSGTLVRVDMELLGLFVKPASGGEEMAWQLPRAVLVEAQKAPPAAPVKVVYRGESDGDRAVTAIELPGKPGEGRTYVNTTGSRAFLFARPDQGGSCDTLPSPGSAPPFTMLLGPMEFADEQLAQQSLACWCCSGIDGTCTPRTKADPGRRIVLVACFS